MVILRERGKLDALVLCRSPSPPSNTDSERIGEGKAVDARKKIVKALEPVSWFKYGEERTCLVRAGRKELECEQGSALRKRRDFVDYLHRPLSRVSPSRAPLTRLPS